MDHYRLWAGEALAAISALILYASMFLDWFDYTTVQNHDLLYYLNAFEPPRNAWEALSYIPVVLAVTVGVAIVTAAVRLGAPRRPSVFLNTSIGVLGLASVILIGLRVIDPPDFAGYTLIFEAAAQPPVFLALASAAGIAAGGFWSVRQSLRQNDSQRARP